MHSSHHNGQSQTHTWMVSQTHTHTLSINSCSHTRGTCSGTYSHTQNTPMVRHKPKRDSKAHRSGGKELGKGPYNQTRLQAGSHAPAATIGAHLGPTHLPHHLTRKCTQHAYRRTRLLPKRAPRTPLLNLVPGGAVNLVAALVLVQPLTAAQHLVAAGRGRTSLGRSVQRHAPTYQTSDP